MTARRFLMLVVAGLACMAAALTAHAEAAPAPKVLSDQWSQVQLEGQPSGWLHNRTVQHPAADGRAESLETITRVSVTVKRGQAAITIMIEGSFFETPEGQPISAKSSQRMGAFVIDQAWTFRGDEIDIETTQLGQTQKQTVANPKDWLPPQAAQRGLVQQLKSGDKEIRTRVMDPASGVQVVETVMTPQGREDVEVIGRVVPALRTKMTISTMPQVANDAWLDERGEMVRFDLVLMPGLTMKVIEADEALAKAKINPPELMASTLITPQGQITQPRKLRSAIYRLSLTPLADGTIPKIDLPRAGYQRVTWGDESTAVVAVNLDEPVNPVADVPDAAHLAVSTMLNHDDPEVKKLLDAAMKDAPANLSKAQTAERLRRFVHSYIQAKNLSVGFASASEVARTRQGDCTEHGVLLAALLRGAGIPGRTASGLIYAQEFLGQRGVFGYHMWTQAWLTDKDHGGWVDLDATLDDATPFDATHITLGTQKLDGIGTGNDMVQMTGVIGRLSIEVVEAE